MKHFAKNDPFPKAHKWYRKKTTVPMVKMEENFTCESREGFLEGKAGDYLAQDGYGGFYPVGAEFHKDNYEEVEAEREM